MATPTNQDTTKATTLGSEAITAHLGLKSTAPMRDSNQDPRPKKRLRESLEQYQPDSFQPDAVQLPLLEDEAEAPSKSYYPSEQELKKENHDQILSEKAHYTLLKAQAEGSTDPTVRANILNDMRKAKATIIQLQAANRNPETWGIRIPSNSNFTVVIGRANVKEEERQQFCQQLNEDFSALEEIDPDHIFNTVNTSFQGGQARVTFKSEALKTKFLELVRSKSTIYGMCGPAQDPPRPERYPITIQLEPNHSIDLTRTETIVEQLVKASRHNRRPKKIYYTINKKGKPGVFIHVEFDNFDAWRAVCKYGASLPTINGSLKRVPTYGSKRILGNYAAVLEASPSPEWPSNFSDSDLLEAAKAIIGREVVNRVFRFYNYTSKVQKKAYIVINEDTTSIEKARGFHGCARTIPGRGPTELKFTKYKNFIRDYTLLFEGKIPEEQVLLNDSD
jgi:hypothetical protein